MKDERWNCKQIHEEIVASFYGAFSTYEKYIYNVIYLFERLKSDSWKFSAWKISMNNNLNLVEIKS